jgi:pentatricopeptide repeat protein
MLIWHALALERQVLLTSTQLSLLTTCAEILKSLLFPMTWSHAYIPVLPHFMIAILSAPMPFLCGIDKSNLPQALSDLSPECIVVDLDKNVVSMGPQTPALPPLPPQLQASFAAALEDAAGMVFREVRCLSKKDDASNMGQFLLPHMKDMSDAAWEGQLLLMDEAFHLYYTPEECRKNWLNGDAPDYSYNNANNTSTDGNVPLHIRVMTKTERSKLKKQSNWDAVQEAFFGSMVYMLRNYRKFLVFPTKRGAPDGLDESGASDGAPAIQDYSYGGAGFRTDQFVRSQKFDMQPFLKQLCQTQQFDNFVTKRLYSSGEADVLFFDQAIHKLYGTNQGLLSQALKSPGAPHNRKGIMAGALLRNRAASQKSSGSSGGNNNTNNDHPTAEPLLQSAGVRRLLKTVVPPEPSGADLPQASPSMEMQQEVLEFLKKEEGNAHQHSRHDYHDDDISVISTSSAGSYSLKSAKSGARSTGESKGRKRHSNKKADISSSTYYYPLFPSELDTQLLGDPRPLSSAVLAEFDRQRADAVRFRRKRMHITDEGALSEEGGSKGGFDAAQANMNPFPEVATFSLFFQAFTALIGKELIQVALKPTYSDKDTILSTYDYDQAMRDKEIQLKEEELSLMTATVSTLGDADGEQSLSMQSPPSLLRVPRVEDAQVEVGNNENDDVADVVSPPDLGSSMRSSLVAADEFQSEDDEEENVHTNDDNDNAALALKNDAEGQLLPTETHGSKDETDTELVSTKELELEKAQEVEPPAEEEEQANKDVHLDGMKDSATVENEEDDADANAHALNDETLTFNHDDNVTVIDEKATVDETLKSSSSVEGEDEGESDTRDKDENEDENDEAIKLKETDKSDDIKSTSSDHSSVAEILPTDTYESEYIKDGDDYNSNDGSDDDDDDRNYFPQNGPGRFRRTRQNSIGSYNSDPDYYDDDADAYNRDAATGPSKLDMFTQNLDTSFGVEELTAAALDGSGLAHKTLQGRDSMDEDDGEEEEQGNASGDSLQKDDTQESAQDVTAESEAEADVETLSTKTEADGSHDHDVVDKQDSFKEEASEEIAAPEEEASDEESDKQSNANATEDVKKVQGNAATSKEEGALSDSEDVNGKDVTLKESDAAASEAAGGDETAAAVATAAETPEKKASALDKDVTIEASMDQEDATVTQLQSAVSFPDDDEVEVEVEKTKGADAIAAAANDNHETKENDTKADAEEEEVTQEQGKNKDVIKDSTGDTNTADQDVDADDKEDGDGDLNELKVVVPISSSNEGLDIELPVPQEQDKENDVDEDGNVKVDAKDSTEALDAEQEAAHTVTCVLSVSGPEEDGHKDVELEKEDKPAKANAIEESREDAKGSGDTKDESTATAVVTAKDDGELIEEDAPPPPPPATSTPFVVTSNAEAVEWMGTADRSGSNEPASATSFSTEQQLQDAEEYLHASQKRVRSLVKHVSERALTSNLGKRLNEKSAPVMRQVSDKALSTPIGRRWSKSMAMQRTKSETVSMRGSGMAGAAASASSVTSQTSKAVLSRSASLPGHAKSRFTDKLTVLEMEEAKATAKAQLGLAFDILQMMRERTLKADPSVYQSLIGACGRCGDTERATQLLGRMHEDGIVADGVVYACLVSAFSAENAYKKKLGLQPDKANLPEWANGATLDMDWNSLRRQSVAQVAKKRVSELSHRIREGLEEDITDNAGQDGGELSSPRGMARFRKRSGNVFNSLRGKKHNSKKNNDNHALDDASSNNGPNDASASGTTTKEEMTVTEPCLMQILLGENLLELVYPDILIEMDTESCPRCNRHLTDAEIVAGWKSADPQNYTTCCPSCTQTFVPHFSVQSSSPSFVGSRGPDSPLFCQRLSPWVLQKELRTVMMSSSSSQGGNNTLNSSFRDEFLTTEWRQRETRNATLWWNLVVSFMRYRLPITFLLQGNFQASLIAPTPSYEEGTEYSN